MTTTVAQTTCKHCHTPFDASKGEAFCCNGCEYVYQLLHDEGFTRFYELKGNQSSPPIGSKAFKRSDYTWLKEAIEISEADESIELCQQRFRIRGISCLGCVWLIEAVFNARVGSHSIGIDTSRGTIELNWYKGRFDGPAFAAALEKLGYEVVPDSSGPSTPTDSRLLSRRIGICGFFLLNTMLFTLPGYLGMEEDYFLSPLFSLLSALFATFSILVGGSYFFERTLTTLRHRTLSIDFPIALGLIVAFAGSLIGWLSGSTDLIYFDFVSTFVFLMLCGRWLQEYALERNQSHLNQRKPDSQYITTVGPDGPGERKAVEQIEKGERYLIAPGEIIPVCSRSPNESSLSLEWINGEPDPVTWSSQQTIPAGAINVGIKPIEVTAEEQWKDSLLARLLNTGNGTFATKRLQRVISVYIQAVLILAVAGGVSWFASTGSAIKSLQVFISILIVSCPCALGIALPLTNEICQSLLRKAGLFIRTHEIWERLRQVKTIVFDKTGTLTLETPRLLNPGELTKLGPPALSALATLVGDNLHPRARSIRMALMLRHPHLDANQGDRPPEESIGNGVFFQSDDGTCWSLGKPDWTPASQSTSLRLPEKSSPTIFCRNGDPIATFQFEEDLRDNTRASIEQLHSMKYQVAILSGDASRNVQQIAHGLGIDSNSVLAECSPDQKAEWISRNARQSAMMIGDGANDKLAFHEAVCRGTPVVDRSVLESSSDFFFFGRSLSCLPLLLLIARKRQQAVYAVFFLAILYNAAAIFLCLAGMMHPLLAAILMPLSSIASMLVPLYWIRKYIPQAD